ncbi:archaeal proteasome endopeptidase complex subunit beta [Natrinema thermotolerans]|uniref:Proteasome subunit beta n=1 Tax=Natrinema thermotolerans TaxID=121872 RepID=A0AAF0P886_9EURY|nr:archaeal proteasome endopeptidase complex subunit beta [Natrinema thermotolerans]ELZ09619.1 proteasome endopeptidase complex subunit beta [Natrinema thermotolerans DSM 11552]QCC60193.1 proteasome endopeptidase complex, archaeal, beta subunit [Natrinema thermotolerans]QCC61103.1 proteasome endopeptidase complex, archaeal, beta subunit [Natrinema thermotolerans]WMT07208.1 archaeal proteasome endopeptidase complex subunit beta [Natrinema thermotolerans]
MNNPLSQGNGDPSPYEPELGSLPNGGAAGTDDETVNKTGTTTIGITTDEGVVIATDMRASLGGRFVSNKNVQKVEQIHPTGALTLVGSVGGAQSFISTLRAEVNLYESRRDEPMPIEALATLAGNFARGGPFRAINPILGGVDSEGSHVYSIDPAGGVMADDYTVTGSGMQLAYGLLEQEYEDDLSLADAKSVAARAIKSAVERDTGSGNGVFLAEVTGEGVDIQGHEEFDAVI